MKTLFFTLFAAVCLLGAYQFYLVSQIPETTVKSGKEVSADKMEDIRALFAEKERQ